MQLQNKYLENIVTSYRQRLKELSDVVSKSDLDRILMRFGVRDICDVPQNETNGSIDDHIATLNGTNKAVTDSFVSSTPNNDDQLLIETAPKQHFAPVIPPRNFQNQINNTLEALKPSVGTKLEGLLLNSDSDSDFDPRASESESNGNKITNDLFGFEPPKTMGQQLFNNGNATNGVNHLLITNGTTSSPPPLCKKNFNQK